MSLLPFHEVQFRVQLLLHLCGMHCTLCEERASATLDMRHCLVINAEQAQDRQHDFATLAWCFGTLEGSKPHAQKHY